MVVPPVQISTDLKDVLYRGATARQLGLLFGHATLTVEQRLGKVKPSGERNGISIYAVREAAPYLVPPSPDVVEQVLRLNHMGLPPLLKKEYWQGQEAQLRVREKQGELWSSAAVVEYVGMAWRDISTEIKLMSDTVERDTVLSESQRNVIEGLIESLLRSIQERVRLTFGGVFDDPRGRDAGSLLEPEPEEEDPLQGL